ncbi:MULTISPECIES: bifunctional 2-C-methyl-D-erythritol 4-phosphate cytidylyltransferase/2-C-methyl-D-erythritol 2,4-cyclodiphosphate synthase [unclassified Shinella]|uniref:bifunctional 2-C-methyl-D-erythritol 4-phosphate cytidylyltransferase/2-C-methyl-D-erythritol 2,4-cyclodiphosphate synthase n=1 Tax=unclassified Shinella TaxID=2643062 RepID=UPI00225D0CF8|nr:MULTISPECIES: bifunctional 2-C-methyl-D-erythritol 4-phosphate cytidylyltransferase/2-C-methyl-D-erythritol 2,4-cyclodiphosphate synthase [unclassified Shinella]MCO5138351.1 bifunctional 2-C-methyl-D-erythritol 4-phosphate cytidylyltransferase/2-C-methyl-D-erythritol 2,4-cyclodiphosphate synthase [Shinella sp.]MDC7255188.1 bifunctional 2-C-methyl-D-erythritol 4-phosphate cytidylyltransferase/2-C-methyl-D-erythritol 2,4-cyclodiphosphate synthase [Shinella sp. YE25]CAI0337951.1 2-C-methyl-D-ery
MLAENALSCGVVIVAAGRGERAGSHAEGPKQYRRIGGRPVISHTLDLFVNWPHARHIVMVIHPDDAALFETARAAALPAGERLTVVHGGPTRQQSVLAGLEALPADAVSHVLIQDAVRPFVEPAILERTLAAFQHGARAVLPAVAVADTLKRADANGNVAETVSRSGLFAAQTPQSFHLATILEAHRRASASGRTDFTDDASIAEWAGVRVHLVEGSAGNVKLTLQKDIAMADQRLSHGLPDVRTGNGYDVHQLVDGDGVTLCGLFIAHDQTLSGHSDADVALHALTDALLATCGAGDIGDHFPPSDPQWKGAASRIFLEHAAGIVRAKGGTIMNADVSLIAEAPKVGPHREAMRRNLADFLGISIDRCSVKATTNEKIGFIGRREGIAAIATATVVYGGTDA